MGNSPEQCACDLLEVVPVIMRNIRTQMRRHRGMDLSVPQFRSLAFLTNNEGASLSELAEFIGLTLPSASKLVDGLVARKLVLRKTCADDRRRVTLSLTTTGQTAWQSAYRAAQLYLAKLMIALSDTDRATVTQAMQILRNVFVSPVESSQAMVGKASN